MFTNAGQFQVIIGNDVSTFITTSLQYLELKGFKEQGKAAANKTFIPFNVLLPF